MHKRTFIALAIVFTGACAFLFNIFYKEAKNTAITKLNEEQMIHAKQAARGIEDFFATWTRSLDSLSKMDEIIDTDAFGKRYMKLFYEANQEQIRSITRLDERGVILHNFPQSSSVGTDISDQKHVRELLRDHKPVISDVFKAVEGFDAVALHVPIFRGSVFKGSIGILINFQSLAKRYLDVIKIGETGYAWLVSRDGTQLYSPIPGFTGKSVFETIKDSPSLIVMVNDMLKGHEGAAIYTFERIGGRNVGQIREYAVYMPVHIGSTFWSIAVASAEQDVLSGLISFRNRLAFVIGALFICGMVFSILAAKAWFIVKEEEKRKQAEKKLQQSEQIAEKFSTLFHAAPFAMALATTPDGVLYDVNQAWLDLAGLTHKEAVIGKSGVELEIIREAEPRERILNEFRQYGSVRNAEIATHTRAGVPLALLVNLDWVDIGGRKFILSSMQDITERKKAEEALHQKEVELKEAQRIAHIGSWYWDAKTDVTTGTEELLRIYGFDPATPVLMPDFLEQRGRCYPVEEWERLNAAVQTSLKTGIGYELDVQAIRDGEPIWVTTRGEVVSDLDGQIVGLRGAVQDITERKQTEAVLQESQGRLVAELVAMKRLHQIGTRFVRNGELGKVLEEVVDAAIAITGSDMGNLQLLDNSGLLKIVAQRGFEQPFLDFFNSVHEGQAACGTALQQGNRVIVEDIAESVVFAGSPAREVVLASGARAVQSTPLRSRSGHLLGMLSTHYKTPRRPDERDLLFIDVLSQQIGDMLERMRMEEGLRKSRDELELHVRERTAELSATVDRLELVNAELQEFTFIAAHDLQEPLRKIQTFCDMVQKRCALVLDSTTQDYLDRVINAASRMRQLLRDLLEFSRVAARPEPFKKIDLVKIVQEAADVFEVSVKEIGCQIEIENIPAVEADESQMSRLFQNLIGNALKFRGAETPRINVYGKLDRHGICEIFVKDNGIGFEPKFAELIFKPFQRLHGRNEYDGTGMGLAICRKIVERHGETSGLRVSGERLYVHNQTAIKKTRLETIIGQTTIIRPF